MRKNWKKSAAVIPAFKYGSKILTRFEDRHSGVGVRGDTSEKVDEESQAGGGGKGVDEEG